MLNYPLSRLSESGSWVNLLSMIPNQDCHWNLSSQADSSSSLLAHIWFYPIDCHNLLWFFKWSCDRKLIANEKSTKMRRFFFLKPSWIARKISRNNPGNRWKWLITISRCCITWRSKTYYWAIWCRRWWCCCQVDWSQDFEYWRQMPFLRKVGGIKYFNQMSTYNLACEDSEIK